jgi:uncharacterized protein (TIGR00299 family) protein
MTVLYLECGTGAAGDMLTGALMELLSEEKQKEVMTVLNSMMEGVTLTKETVRRSGIAGTLVHVQINGEEEGHEHHHDHHHHTSLKDISERVQSFALPDQVREDVMQVYESIAEAESHAHQMPVSEVHFHEVGMKDAIMDITAVSYLFYILHPDRIIASPVNTGYGTVQCMHGILPVPAPATAYLLQNIPTFTDHDNDPGELCTPTGAALLKHFVTSFGDQPVMKVQQTGYGMGQKEFRTLSCVRAFLGEEEKQDTLIQIVFTVDDMTGEEIGFALEQLWKAGVRDVFTVPVAMKKNRPGTLFNILTEEEKKDEILPVIFRYTATIGVRIQLVERAVLTRRTEEVNGIHVKISSGYGVTRRKFEYEDLARTAEENHMTLQEVKEQQK